MASHTFVNRDHEFVQVNLVSGSLSKKFGLSRGESETVPTDQPVQYAWAPENDVILESEFATFATTTDDRTITFGDPPGRVMR
ncbi:hypothetical protein [Janthinobacterium sp. PC23-8]|uniref:hypothetical protein n=1 Tax=Janthinobacterium sp. PC23-8 TaxID=2012679 RepID=UPI000B97AB27|nr:hypothetical protein [Janthinobacterium sp. PC23-8]OYO27478.1 hypothetical protein CD932_20080 [Janthinobacterium sp. PC23-8]